MIAALFGLCSMNPQSFAAGHLSDNIKIDSQRLGYSIQYRVYTPDGFNQLTQLATIYFTDGPFIAEENGLNAIQVLDQLINDKKISPVIAIFVDPRDPSNLANNRRNQELICKPNYAAFFSDELIPAVDAQFSTSSKRQDRVIAGVSFGGLNAACFGVMLNHRFGGIAMLSPASAQHLKYVTEMYARHEKLNLKIFLSVGTKNDNTAAVRNFRSLLTQKKYPLIYHERPYGHVKQNWKPLLDELLETFFQKPD